MATQVQFLAPCPACGEDVLWTATFTGEVPDCDCTLITALPDASMAPPLVGDVGQGGQLEDAA